jgi:hypothetical protein
MTSVFPATSRGVPVSTTHYKPVSYIPAQTGRVGPNVTDDYERELKNSVEIEENSSFNELRLVYGSKR